MEGHACLAEGLCLFWQANDVLDSVRNLELVAGNWHNSVSLHLGTRLNLHLGHSWLRGHSTRIRGKP